jgi:hypothetical protein
MHHKFAFALASIVAALLTSACWYRNAPAVAPAYQAVKEPVVAGSFVVGPRTFKPYKFVVTTGMSKPRLEGTLSASGARNDIEVTVLDEAQFASWQNRDTFKATYESGRVTDTTLNVELPETPATYYMVFSNRFSLLSNKAVTANVQLCYDRENATAPSGGRGRNGYRRR